MQHIKITFIGASNMAGSIISGLVKGGYPAELICASAPSLNSTQKLKDEFSILNSQNNAESAIWADVVVL